MHQDDVIQHAAFLRRLAGELVRDRHAAEDLVQEGWLAALDRGPRDRGALRAWFATVLERLARRRRVVEGRRRIREEHAARAEATAALGRERQEAAEALLHHLRRLPARSRDVLFLRYYDGLEFGEIGRLLDMEPEAARSRHRRALRSLRRLLDAHLGGGRRWALALLPAWPKAPVAGRSAVRGWMVMSAKMKVSGIAATVLVLGFGAWLLIGSGTPWGSTRPTPPRDRESVSEGMGGSRAEQAIATSPFRENRPEDPATDVTDLDPSDPHGVLVRVVDAETGAPVPHAFVAMDVEDGGLGHRLRRALMSVRTARDLSRRSGRTYRCDDRGEVRVAWSSSAGGLTAWKGDRVERQWRFTTRDQAIVMELRRCTWIDVIVSDPAGRPVAGVPVGLREGVVGGGAFTLVRGTTDSRGRARLGDLHLHSVPTPEWRSHVCIDMPLREPVAVAVNAGSPPEEPVELPMPASGSVTVSVERAAGARGGRLEVAVGPAIEPSAAGHSIPPAGVRVLAVPESGRVTFPHVGVGLDLSVEVWADAASTPVRKTFAGPARAGDAVEVSVTWEDLTPRLAGVAALPDGALLGQTLLHVRAGDQRDAALTDPMGRFAVAFDATAAGGARTLELRRLGAAPLRATVDLPQPMSPGSHDLGVVRFEALPLFATGSVVGVDRVPVPCAAVRLQVGRPGAGGEVAWRSEGEAACTDRDGRFGISLGHPGGSGPDAEPVVHRLHVSAGGRAPALVPIVEGARDVVVTLEKGASCTALLRVPEGVGPRHLDVRLLSRESGRFVPRRTFEVRGRNEIAAVFDHLSQGEHELQVRLLRPTLAVWTIPDLCVPPTGVLADPRLSPIDLRAALRATRVTVRSERGDELAEPSFRLFRGDERTLWFRSHSLDPAVGLLLPEGWGIEVGHADHLATAVRQPSPVEDVRLRAGMRVRLHADGIALPAGYALVGRMRDPEGRSSARLAFDAMGSSGVVTTEALGPHHVLLSLRGEVGGQARYHRIRPDLAVDVLDARGVQDLVLPVDQASIDSAAEDAR